MGRAAMMPHSFIIILYACNYPPIPPRGRALLYDTYDVRTDDIPRGSECVVNAIFHILPLQRRCDFRCTPQRGYRAGVAHCIPYLATGGNSSSHFKKITGTGCHASARLRWSQAVSAAPCAKAWRP